MKPDDASKHDHVHPPNPLAVADEEGMQGGMRPGELKKQPERRADLRDLKRTETRRTMGSREATVPMEHSGQPRKHGRHRGPRGGETSTHRS